MALKPDRTARPRYKAAGYFMDEAAERGGFLVKGSTVGSGYALDQASQIATYAANPSGKYVLGMLLEDMVDVDLTRYKLNQHKQEVQRGSKVTIAELGPFYTNMNEGTITDGPCYLGHSGRVRSTIDNNVANTPLVGVVEALPDEDGFFKVHFNLP